MDLVIGATGILGTQIVQRLIAAGRPVRAMVRSSSDPAKRQALEAMGAQIVVGDLKQPESLRAACAEVSNVITTASSTLSRSDGDDIESVDRHGSLSLIAAAKECGVNHFVFLSFPDVSKDNPLQDAKRAVETALRQSGLCYTILQPTHFFEVWCSPALGFDPANAKVRVFGKGAGSMHWVSMFDVADAAIASLDNPRAVNQSFVVSGPEVLTQDQIIRRCEKLSGRTFQREIIPLEALVADHGTTTDPLAKTFAALTLQCGEGGWVFDSTPMREALGIEPRSIDGYLKQVCGDAASA